MKFQPLISIIIPVREMNNYLINENFPAIDKLEYNKFEVIVLSDRPVKEKRPLLKKYPWLQIVFSEKNLRPAEKRNLGGRLSKGEIIAFIDDDAYPDKKWLGGALQLFQDPLIYAVCGPGILPKRTNLWEKIFDEVLKSWIGSGGYGYRFVKQKRRTVDDYPSMNFLIRKDVFKKLHGFNNNYWPGEDSKLCEDIVYKKKGTIIYDPNVFVYHHRRNNLISFIKQHVNYGFHRGAFFAHGDRNSRRLSYLIPTFFVLYLLMAILAIVYSPKPTFFLSIILMPLFLYVLGLIYISFKSLINTKNVAIAILAPFVLFLTHVFYGIMFVKGFITGLIKKEKIYNGKS